MEDNDLIAFAVKLVQLLPMLPPWVATVARIVAETSFLLSLAAAAAKRLGLGDPDPAKDPRWKQRLYAAMQVIDFLAANTTPIRALDKHRDELARASMRPPPGD